MVSIRVKSVLALLFQLRFSSLFELPEAREQLALFKSTEQAIRSVLTAL